MIETPTATAYKAIQEADSIEVDAPLLSEDQKSEKQQLQALEADLYLVKQAPITAKLRTTMKHLKVVAGPLSRFRGLHIAILYQGLHSMLVNLICGPIGNRRGSYLIQPFVSVIITVVLCRLEMTWTHTIISMPSTKRWWCRFPSVQAGKNIILPTAISAMAVQFSMYIPTMLLDTIFAALQNLGIYGGDAHTTQKIILVQLFCVVLIFIATYVLIVVPADVTLKRVQASMLPEEDEAIVPFDRTFAGKVQPEVLGGSGAVSMLDAWRTFDKEGRIRLVKLYGKVFLIQFAISIMFAMVMVGELRLIMGKDFDKMVKTAHQAVSRYH